MDSQNSNHGILDCFVLTRVPFRPVGMLKPGRSPEAEAGWFAFDPPADRFAADAGFDLRDLNEGSPARAGSSARRTAQFVHTRTGEPVRFWAVNGPAEQGQGDLQREARTARQARREPRAYPPRLLRRQGRVDPAKIKRGPRRRRGHEGRRIYSHFSIYFPLWLDPAPATPWLAGYDGKSHPFAALYFNPDFQEHTAAGGRPCSPARPAPASASSTTRPSSGLEIQNEDSYFFWTFNDEDIPDAQLRLLEGQFGDWLKKKYGSLDAAFARGRARRWAATTGRGARRFSPPLEHRQRAHAPRQRHRPFPRWSVSADFYSDTSASCATSASRG